MTTAGRALVSCIVPCFNGRRYLDEALSSIFAQTHRALEVIVVDDGSTDGSEVIVRRYGAAVRYHRQDNGGPAAACNQGLALATGAFVAFLEQDDVWIPDKTSRQLAAFDADPALGYCVGHAQNFWVPELVHEARRHFGKPVMRPVPGYVVQTLLARRETFEQVGCFDASRPFAFAGDWFLRARELGIAERLLPDVVTRRRLHQDNFSRRNREASREEFLHVIKASLDRRRGKG